MDEKGDIMTAGYGYGYGVGAYGVGAYGAAGIGLDDLILSNQIADGTATTVSAANEAGKDAVSAAGEAGKDAVMATGDAAARILSDANNNANFVRGSVEAHGLRNNDALHGLGRSVGDVRDSVRDEGRSTEKGFGDTRDTIRQEGRLNETGFARINDNIFNEGQQLKLKLCDTDAKVAAGFADVRVEALQHKFELSRQMAECCCETKELIRASQNETAQLLKDNENSRLKDELQMARMAALVNGNGPGNS